MAADYLTGKDGAVSIDTGTPIVLSIIEFRYRETSDVARGRAAGDRGTGRTHLATDWELTVRARTTLAATTPNLLRRGADVAFIAKTDGSGTPALTITGSGLNDETTVAVPAGDYVEFNMRIVCDAPDGASLPTLTLGMSDRLTDRPSKREELLAAARRHLDYGAGPQGPPNGKAPLTTAIQVPLPDGREVWVHPVSLEQAMWLNLRSAEAIAKLNLRTEEQVRTAHLYYGPVFQLIEACRVGPEPDAAPVFQPEDAEWLFRARGWLPVVRQIANLSDQLSGEEFLRSAFTDFFAVWEQRLAMLSSRLSAASIASCRRDLEALASFASRTRQRGTLSVREIPELSEEEEAGEAPADDAGRDG